jgi:hypothetical protein
MDYRHTEDFARRMELAELRAQVLRKEAVAAFFSAVGRGVRRGLQVLVAQLTRSRAAGP